MSSSLGITFNVPFLMVIKDAAAFAIFSMSDSRLSVVKEDDDYDEQATAIAPPADVGEFNPDDADEQVAKAKSTDFETHQF